MSSATGERVLWKGLVAGLAAGVAATVAKSIAERVYPPRTHGEPEPPNELAEKLSEKVTGHRLSEEGEELAAEAIHWGFGVAAGGFYGVLAEFYPAATEKQGATFGLALMSLTHQKALPALGLSEDPEDQTLRERTSEGATHVIYGVVAEKVRGWVRSALD